MSMPEALESLQATMAAKAAGKLQHAAPKDRAVDSSNETAVACAEIIEGMNATLEAMPRDKRIDRERAIVGLDLHVAKMQAAKERDDRAESLRRQKRRRKRNARKHPFTSVNHAGEADDEPQLKMFPAPHRPTGFGTGQKRRHQDDPRWDLRY